MLAALCFAIVSMLCACGVNRAIDRAFYPGTYATPTPIVVVVTSTPTPTPTPVPAASPVKATPTPVPVTRPVKATPTPRVKAAIRIGTPIPLAETIALREDGELGGLGLELEELMKQRATLNERAEDLKIRILRMRELEHLGERTYTKGEKTGIKTKQGEASTSTHAVEEGTEIKVGYGDLWRDSEHMGHERMRILQDVVRLDEEIAAKMTEMEIRREELRKALHEPPK